VLAKRLRCRVELKAQDTAVSRPRGTRPREAERAAREQQSFGVRAAKGGVDAHRNRC
jgi:hypothetical protein